MNDVAAQMAHWLAGGRTAALVAPVVRLATAPGSHDLSKRAGRARDVLSDLDLETTRRAIERLSRDRRFREAISEAGQRPRLAPGGGSTSPWSLSDRAHVGGSPSPR